MWKKCGPWRTERLPPRNRKLHCKSGESLMQRRAEKTRVLVSLTLLLLASARLAPAGLMAQSTAPKAYEAAYSLILEEKWSDAQKALTGFIKEHPKSNLVDAAQYWNCYTRDKLGENKEAVFNCYRTFIKEYPKSKWVKDARSNMVNIGYQLSREGKPEYEKIVKGMDEAGDEDVKLAALYALGNMGSKEAYSTIVSLYAGMPSENIRSKIVYILGNFETSESRQKLSEIALKDPSIKVRKDAGYAIGNSGGRGWVSAHEKVGHADADPELRTAALYTIGNVEGDSAAS